MLVIFYSSINWDYGLLCGSWKNRSRVCHEKKWVLSLIHQQINRLCSLSSAFPLGARLSSWRRRVQTSWLQNPPSLAPCTMRGRLMGPCLSQKKHKRENCLFDSQLSWFGLTKSLDLKFSWLQIYSNFFLVLFTIINLIVFCKKHFFLDSGKEASSHWSFLADTCFYHL